MNLNDKLADAFHMGQQTTTIEGKKYLLPDWQTASSDTERKIRKGEYVLHTVLQIVYVNLPEKDVFRQIKRCELSLF